MTRAELERRLKIAKKLQRAQRDAGNERRAKGFNRIITETERRLAQFG